MKNLINKQTILTTLKSNGLQLRQYGVEQIGLFGSYVRNENSPESDIDIYISFQKNKETFDNFMSVCYLLDELFPDKKVEVITAGSLSPYFEPRILKSVEYVPISS